MSDSWVPDLADMPAEVLEDWAEELGLHEHQVDHDLLPRCACGWEAEKAMDVAAYDAHLVGVAYRSIANRVAAWTLRKAADRIDLRQAELAHLGDISAWEYDTPRDYSEDLAKAWLADEAEAALDT